MCGDARITPAEQTALGHAECRGVRGVLLGGADLVQLADVHDQGAHSGQHADTEQHRDQHSDRATLVASELPDNPARERGHQVSHGMTP